MAQSSDFRLPYNDLLQYVPQNLRNPVITALLDNLFSRFLTHDESIPLYGYVGRRPVNLEDRTPRVPQLNVERDINSIIPVFNFKVGADRYAFTVQDLIKKAEAIGVQPGNWKWLYSQGNNFIPPIDLDKFTNFFNYYWTAKALPTVPDVPWNPELLPEYYVMAAPLPGDLNKLNVVAATTENIVLTGTGFNKLAFQLDFTNPTEFTITPTDTLGVYVPVQSTFEIGSDPDVHIDYEVTGPRGTFKLLEFNIVRDEIFDQTGSSVGQASFEAGDRFLIDVTFLTRNYTVSFTGTSAVKGKLTKVKALNQYQVIDGVQLRKGDRVLVKNANPMEAGIYVVSPGSWKRSADFSGETAEAGARVFVKDGAVNGQKLFQSYANAGGGFYWQVVPGMTESNTNQWQEGNYWVRGEALSELGLTRADVIQAVRPIIEYIGDLQLNGFVSAGLPAESGIAYRQVKTEFNQLPLFDLFRYDGTHSGLVSSVFYYEEDLTAELDLALQRRVLKNANADFIFNHGLMDEGNQLLFVKRGSALKTIWHPGYLEPIIVDVTYTGIGNGVLEGLTAHGFTQQQIWTLTAETASTFRAAGSKLPKLTNSTVTVDEPYSNGEFSVTITAGSIPFEVGDTFLFRVGNIESARYVYRDEIDSIFDLHGGPLADLTNKGAWQVPRLFYHNPYNESRSALSEGVLYSHFRGILVNQVEGKPIDLAFGGSIKLWSEQQTLLAALLMQRDLTPISIIDLAQRQYEIALNSIRDLYERNVVQFLAAHGSLTTPADIEALFAYLQAIRVDDNDVRTVLYDSTSPVLGFPPTLPQLGAGELTTPTIDFDLVLGRTLLTHHDGHKSPLFEDTLDFRQAIFSASTRVLRSDGTFTPAVGSFTTAPLKPYQGELWVKPDGTVWSYSVTSDSSTPINPEIGAFWYKRDANELYSWNGVDWLQEVNLTAPWTMIDLAGALNSLLLYIETKLHDGINPNARKYNFEAALSDPAFQAQLKKELFSFAAVNYYDPLGSDYDPADAFTWNYSLTPIASLPTLATSAVPARWYNLLKAHQKTVPGVIPTERPNLEPWKLLGFEDRLTWWQQLTPAQQAAYTPYVTFEQLAVGSFIDGGLVKAVKTTNGDTILFNLQQIDGVDLLSGDLVLLQNEVTSTNNGIWVVSSTDWSRALINLVPGLYVKVTAGFLNKGSTWVVSSTSPPRFEQARAWSNQLWDDIKLARPSLRLSVDARNDALLPPYVSPLSGWSINALTTSIPPGVSLNYEFGADSPVEAVWKASLEYRYSLVRALFRYDPLAFLGFCWGFNWVPVDGILYDGFDLNAPGHRRFHLHGETIEPIIRATPAILGSGAALTLICTAHDVEHRQNFTVSLGNKVLGYVQEGVPATIGGYSFTLEDGGKPFRIGDKFELTSTGAVFTPALTYQFMGFGQTFTHALRELSIDTAAGYAISAYRDWDVNMGYRAGGLVATDDLQVYTDSGTLSTAAFDLLFKKNPLAQDHWVQALRVSVLQIGQAVSKEVGYAPETDGGDWIFRIEGYNPRYLDISYYALETNSMALSFYALSKAHTELAWTHPTTVTSVVTATLPIIITGLQSVVNFLFGYERYLEDKGWEFNNHSEFNVDAETGRTRNFQLEIEKLIDACYSGIVVGQGQIINPFIDRAWVNQETGLLAQFTDTSLFDIAGHPGIFDAFGAKYKVEDLDVARSNEQSTFSASGPMFSAHVQVDEFEHIFIFNNYSQPSTAAGLLYDPFSGGRVTTYKFNGRKQATKTMRPEFGGHFLIGNQVHQNLQASTDNVTAFYDANRAFESETTTRHSLALLGFSTKAYFDDLDISNKTQFNFWRGLIQSKGTNSSIDAYLNNNRFHDAKIDEYWAYKVAEYGDARQRSFPELKLSVNDALTQFTQLQFDSTSLAPTFTTIDRFDESRWFSIDDMNQDAYFTAEVIGTYVLPTVEVSALYELPFIADYLTGGGFTQINATTIQANGPISLIGYGPARPRFNPIKLFNYVDDELIAEISLWHPAAGQHTPAALESVNVISNINPARYNYSTQIVDNNSYDPLRPWGANEVGRVWLDTRNLAYLPYYDPIIFSSLDERLSRWGTLADYATIDVYEWVQSAVPPAEYNTLALSQAGNADLDQLTKAAGQAANQETYARDRVWFARPIAWSYSPVPTNVDWGGNPPFPGGSFNSRLFFDANDTVSLELGSFADFGITAGSRIGAWDPTEHSPKPVSEYIIEDNFTRVLVETGAAGAGPIPALIEVISTGSSPLSGQLLFTAVPTEVTQRTSSDGEGVPVWDVLASLRVIEVNTGKTEDVVISSEVGTSATGTLHGAVSTFTDGQLVIIDLPVFELRLSAQVITGGTYSADALRDTFVAALAARFWVRNAVRVTPVISNPSEIISPLSNDPLDPEAALNNGIGWRAWTTPTQAELNADGHFPSSSWRPYLGDFKAVTGTLLQMQDAIAYAKDPRILNDGTVIERYRTTWTNWVVLKNALLTQTQVVTGPLTFNHTESIDQVATSVYVNGIAQLKAAFTITGKNLTVTSVLAGSKVTVIIRKYQPTPAELAFDPEVTDDLTVQRQFKQDYEYVALQIRDKEGPLASTLYYFWVKNKTTPATGKKLSVQAITQLLRDGPSNFLTFQGFKGNGSNVISLTDPENTGPYRYDAITISGLSYIVTKNDTFKLRFTRNFTLRDDPEELNLKDVHTEWALMRPGQKTKVPEALWQKLTDSVAGIDVAGNAVPAVRRVLYDERRGTRTRFGFDVEQTLAPAELLKASITHTILNTKLIDTSTLVSVPDYIAFLDLDESAAWFADAAVARKTMTDIWNQAKVEQINEIFFAALNDILASNFQLSDVFKTSMLSAYSIKLIDTTSAQPTYE